MIGEKVMEKRLGKGGKRKKTDGGMAEDGRK